MLIYKDQCICLYCNRQAQIGTFSSVPMVLKTKNNNQNNILKNDTRLVHSQLNESTLVFTGKFWGPCRKFRRVHV